VLLRKLVVVSFFFFFFFFFFFLGLLLLLSAAPRAFPKQSRKKKTFGCVDLRERKVQKRREKKNPKP